MWSGHRIYESPDYLSMGWRVDARAADSDPKGAPSAESAGRLKRKDGAKSMSDYQYYDSIAITGHRDYGDPAAMYRGLDRIGARQFYFGGARGIDTDALIYVAETKPQSIRTVVVPNRLADQPVAARAAIRQHATNIIELKNTGPDRYQFRNQYMVNRADKTVGFYNYTGRGGTYQTINYARSQGKLLEVNPLVDFNRDDILQRSHDQQVEWIREMHSFKTDLSAIKGIVLDIILRNLRMSVHDFCDSLGFPGCASLEQLWSY